MRPYYEERGITIYHGDCREVLPELYSPKHNDLRCMKFDLILTDPPFGLDDKWNGGTWAAHSRYKHKWDSKTFEDITLADVRQSGAHCIIWGGNYYQLPISRCWLCWDKMPKPPTLADFELAWTNLDMPSKLFFAWRGADGVTGHPTPKPISLMKWCLSLVPQAKTLLDPFCGSGSSLIAAKDIGFKTIVGIEKEEKYCELAVSRLAQSVLEL